MGPKSALSVGRNGWLNEGIKRWKLFDNQNLKSTPKKGDRIKFEPIQYFQIYLKYKLFRNFFLKGVQTQQESSNLLNLFSGLGAESIFIRKNIRFLAQKNSEWTHNNEST